MAGVSYARWSSASLVNEYDDDDDDRGRNKTNEVSFGLDAHHSAERHDRADDGEEDEEDRSDTLQLERVSDVAQVVRVPVLYVVDEAAVYSIGNDAQHAPSVYNTYMLFIVVVKIDWEFEFYEF